MNDYVHLTFNASSDNEQFIRTAASAFALRLNPTVQDIYEVKTIVSEAVTNCIIHAYEENKEGIIEVEMSIDGDEMNIYIKDFGCGIDDIDQAMEPMYTSKPEKERSGLGFSIMQQFSDDMKVSSKKGEGTEIRIKKKIKQEE